MLPLEASERVNQALLELVESVTQSKVRHVPRVSDVTKRSIVRRLLDRVSALFRQE